MHQRPGALRDDETAAGGGRGGSNVRRAAPSINPLKAAPAQAHAPIIESSPGPEDKRRDKIVASADHSLPARSKYNAAARLATCVIVVRRSVRLCGSLASRARLIAIISQRILTEWV